MVSVRKNDYEMTTFWKVANVIVLVGITVGFIVVSIFMDNISRFAAISAGGILFIALLALVSFVLQYRD